MLNLYDVEMMCKQSNLWYRKVRLYTIQTDVEEIQFYAIETENILFVESQWIEPSLSAFTEYNPVLRAFHLTEYVVVDVIERLYGSLDEIHDQQSFANKRNVSDTVFNDGHYRVVEDSSAST